MKRVTRTLSIVVAAVAAATLTLSAGGAAASDRVHARKGWSGSWAAAQQAPFAGWGTPNWSTAGFTNQSVRQVVRTSVAGSSLRIRLSNRYGTTPLRIAGAAVARTTTGAATRPGTSRPVTFAHRQSVTIPVGAETASDAVGLSTSPLESLTITLYLADPTGPATFHESAIATTYRASGDHRFDPGGAAFTETTSSWYYLAGVDVTGGRSRGTVVAFGDSLTDGFGTTPDANRRYPDVLAGRLAAAGQPIGVVNAGIDGNRLFSGFACTGEGGLARFGRDALAAPGVRTVIVLIGINDVVASGVPDFGCGENPVVGTAELIAGYLELIRTAHTRGVKIIGSTLTPMKHAEGYDTPDNELVRDQVNQWIRTSGSFDGVVDFAAVLADPDDSDALHPSYDSPDHLHPNDAGRRAMAESIQLTSL